MRASNLLLMGVFAAGLTLAGFTASAGPDTLPAPAGQMRRKPQAEVPAAEQAPPSVPLSTQSAPKASAVSAQAPAAPRALTKKDSARDLFAAAKEPANLAAKSIGFYARGCLAGGQPLPVNGPAWQVMRVSRNRNWGHPSLIRYIERFASDAKEKDGWPGLLVGDLSMPRGGPMPYGHASHQDGLDVDIWYKSEPDRELSAEEREKMPMESFLLDPGHVNPAMWSPGYEKLLRRAVSYPEVARVFVNPAIKKWLCDNAKGDRHFLSKITPIMGHADHFHVRLVCPAGNPGCENQAALKADEGCGKNLDKWIEALMKQQKAAPPASPAAPATTKLGSLKNKLKAWKDKILPATKKPPVPLGTLPPECEAVLKAPPVASASIAAAR